MRAANALPACACNATPHALACSIVAPRAVKPVISPESTSPDPDVGKTIFPPSCRHSETSGAPMNVVAPLSATTAFHRRAASSTAASGSSSTRDLSLPLKCANSPACGVSNIGDEGRLGAADDAGARLDGRASVRQYVLDPQ